jgi:hypothetical protein
MTRNSYTTVSLALLLFLLTATAIGCASDSKKWKFATWDVRKAVGLKKEEEKPEPEVPTRLVATWTETVLNTAGEKPKRGFGGRIAFFKRESDDPIRVDGQLVVYAFDETSRPSHETHPTRKYIFPADEFVRHEGDSKIGTSYSFWLPWDEVGGSQRNISLIARFEPKEGPIVIGEQTKHFLPGTALDAQAPQLAGGERSDVVNAVRLAAYSQQAAAAVPDLAEPPAAAKGGPTMPDKLQMSTATIALPSRLGAALKENTTAFDARETAALPLSQLSSMKSQQPSVATPLQQPESATAAPQAVAPTAPPEEPARPTAAAAAAPGSLRDSLLGTLPAQARQSAPKAPGRAR